MASREPAPGGGAVAAVTVAAAAALVAMTGRFSDRMADVGPLILEADALRDEACELAERDARSYAAVLAAYRSAADDEQRRRATIRSALTVAADVPLAVVHAAQRTAALGVRVATQGNPNLRGDAVTAVSLAEAAARSAAHLVALNTRLGELGPERSERAAEWCADLQAAVRTVETTV